MPTGAMSENFTYVFCECRPSIPFFGAQAKKHRAANKDKAGHKVVKTYYLCICEKGDFYLPLQSNQKQIEEFNAKHMSCVEQRKFKMKEEKACGIFSLKVYRENLRRLFCELETANYIESREKIRSERLEETEKEMCVEEEEVEKEKEKISLEEEEKEKEKISLDEEEELQSAVAYLEGLNEKALEDPFSIDFLSSLTMKDTEVEKEDGNEEVEKVMEICLIDENGEVMETEVEEENEVCLKEREEVGERRKAVREMPTVANAQSELKDQLSRERRWKEALATKVEKLEKRIELYKERDGDMVKQQQKLDEREAVVESVEKVLSSRTADLERRERAVKEIDEKIALEKRDMWKKQKAFEELANSARKRFEAKEAKIQEMQGKIEEKKEEALKAVNERREQLKKTVREESTAEEAMRRRAVIHIPILKNEIAGEPFLEEGETRSSQCFGEPVVTCGHLQLTLTGEIKRIRWRNSQTKCLELKRRREEEEEDSSSEEEDSSLKRRKI